MGGGVGRKRGFSLSDEFGFEFEPRRILPSPLFNVAGEETEHCPDQKDKSDGVEDDRNGRESRAVVSEDRENTADKQEDDLNEEKGVV